MIDTVTRFFNEAKEHGSRVFYFSKYGKQYFQWHVTDLKITYKDNPREFQYKKEMEFAYREFDGPIDPYRLDCMRNERKVVLQIIRFEYSLRNNYIPFKFKYHIDDDEWITYERDGKKCLKASWGGLCEFCFDKNYDAESPTFKNLLNKFNEIEL